VQTRSACPPWFAWREDTEAAPPPPFARKGVKQTVGCAQTRLLAPLRVVCRGDMQTRGVHQNEKGVPPNLPFVHRGEHEQWRARKPRIAPLPFLCPPSPFACLGLHELGPWEWEGACPLPLPPTYLQIGHTNGRVQKWEGLLLHLQLQAGGHAMGHAACTHPI